MLRIREDGLTEEQQTPLELDNWQGSLFKGGDFPKMRLETWDKKKRKLTNDPSGAPTHVLPVKVALHFLYEKCRSMPGK